MEIKKSKKSKKPLVAAIILLAVGSTGYGTYAAINGMWPFESRQVTEKPTSDEKEHTSNTDTDVPDSSNTDEEQDSTIVGWDQRDDYEKIVENSHFKIRKKSGEYYVTLYAIINKPEQYDDYMAQLKEYKQEANSYLSDKGINLDEATINYEPEEAEDL